MEAKIEEKPVKKAKPVEPKRVFSKDMELISDLFKLEKAMFMKNIGYGPNPILTSVEHCHFYRTVDSNGKRPNKCNAVGGHWHDIKVEVDAKGNFVGTCSPAIGSRPEDKHIHDISYIRSDKIHKRKFSEEAQKSIAAHTPPLAKDKY